MSTSLTVLETAQTLPAALGPDLAAAVDLAKAEKAASTRKAYGTDFRLFKAWCDGKGVSASRPAPRRWRPFWRRRLATAPSPRPLAGVSLRSATRTSWRTSTRQRTRKPSRQHCGASGARSAAPRSARPLPSPPRCRAWWRWPRIGLTGLRDRALLLLGFAGAFRRSELVALDVADIEETETGLLVTIRRSKTDQEGEGVTIAIARGDCRLPCQALAGMAGRGRYRDRPDLPPDQQGRHGGSRAPDRPIRGQYRQGLCRPAGFDASTFSGHSLRSGFLTSAAAKGASIFKMMDVSRHKSVDTLRGYVRDAELFKDHAGAGLL